MSKHTPTPWPTSIELEARGRLDKLHPVIELNRGNYDFAAYRINCHDELVEALRRYGHHDNFPRECEAIANEDPSKCTCGFTAAISKAEGK